MGAKGGMYEFLSERGEGIDEQFQPLLLLTSTNGEGMGLN